MGHIQELLTVCLNLSIICFMVTGMLNVGMSMTFRQVLEPLRNVRLTIKSLVTSYILVPLIAILIARVIHLAEPLKVGLVLLSMTAGIEAGPKAIGIAKGNVAFATSLLGLQLIVTIIYVPFVISVLLPEVSINTIKMLIKLSVVVFLPLVLGLFLKSRHDAIAERLNRHMHSISTFSLIVMVALIFILHSRELLRLTGTGAILAGVLFIVFAFTAGYLTGGTGRDNRLTLAFMSSGRNFGIPFMIASQAFNDPDVILMMIVTLILLMAITLPPVFWLGRRTAA